MCNDGQVQMIPLLYVFSSTRVYFFFFFFNDTATTEIYTLSLHDALPISTTSRRRSWAGGSCPCSRSPQDRARAASARRDRKSTRLNSSHSQISYAVFCLKKKKIKRSLTQL